MASVPKPETETDIALDYMSGYGNEHSSEALPGALPVGQFSPQRVPYGLYTEKFSNTSFLVPRARNRRTWFYRIRPSVIQGRFEPIDKGRLLSGPIDEIAAMPNQLRWDPFPVPPDAGDFVDGLVTLAANGDVRMQSGIGIHVYLAARPMNTRYFYDADGELLLVPQQGRLRVHSECGIFEIAPGEIGVIPRGMKFRVMLPDGPSRGFVCENYGMPLELPERGPVGSDGYANDRDFMTPVAAYEDRDDDCELICKFSGGLFASRLDHSPLDVVAWIGTSVPYKYDLTRFNTIGTLSYDHPDPSIYTVLTSPSDTPGVANVDFVIFPERWMVAEDTFRPPWFHRNVMSEFVSLIRGGYDAKGAGFQAGGASLHNCMSAHGPDTQAFEAAEQADLKPVKLENTLAFMFESRYVIHPTCFAMDADQLQDDYLDCWQGLTRHFKGK
jgi:homogentisate 1,2-dioxygenase